MIAASAVAVGCTVGALPDQLPDILLIGLAGVAIFAIIAVLIDAALSGRFAILREAFDASPDAQLITTTDGRVWRANPVFAQLFAAGGSPSPNSIENAAVSPEAVADLRAMRESTKNGIAGKITIALRAADAGPARSYQVSVRPIAGRTTLQLWTIRSLEPTSCNGSQAGQTDFAVGKLLDGVGLGFYLLNEYGQFLNANGTLASWLCVTADELAASGAKLRDFVIDLPPAPGPAADADDPVSAPIIVTIRTSHGGSLDVELRQSCGRSAGDIRTYGVLRRRSDVARDGDADPGSSEARLFFAEAPVGIAVLDRSGRFTAVNRALADQFDTSPAALVGRELIELLNPDDREAVALRLATVAAGHGDQSPIELRPAPPRERTMVLLLSRAAALGEKAGIDRNSARADETMPRSSAAMDPPHNLTLYFIDVTERKQLEAQIAQSQKMQAIGRLAGGVAHDFNNLLTAITGFCDLLLLRSRPGDPAFPDIMQIKQNANRAANLVRQLLAFSRQQNLKPQILDITDVLSELTHLLQRLIGENIELDFFHGRDLGLVKVDLGQLEQVVINLAVNARDAMPDGGKLTIRTDNLRQDAAIRRGTETIPAGDYVLIEVTDTGFGIAPAILTRIFEPFFSTKEIGSGTGLGLSTVYGIVKQTGGFVFVESDPGNGTTFSIYLPRHCGAETVAFDLVEPEARMLRDLTGSATIMLVEDDDAVRMFGARALRNKGYRVIEAKSGEAALAVIRDRDEPIDLVITDVVMPQIDGPALIREVRAIKDRMKVIFISGYAEDTFRDRLGAEDDIHFLAKPFNLKQLALKVKDVLRSNRDQLQFSDCRLEQKRYNPGSTARCTAAPAVE